MDRKACLIVIDGWGISPCKIKDGESLERIHENLMKYDAIANANTPNMNALIRDYPSTQLKAHGVAVGLPK